ncbi:L,D-transpeptidase family protein [Lysobacter enzymogenes]|nr:L,D-transpeptidase family protein [Lysobacter enzymogenes]
MSASLRSNRAKDAIPAMVAAALLAVALAWAAPASARTPPAMAAKAEQADFIVVDKSARRMQLLRGGKLLKSYAILLGDAPTGHKRQQGDERTPEGEYRISGRNQNSRFHLSLRVSYPNAADRKQAQARGVDPGGDIMIHGGTPPGYRRDWTDGCIAVTDREIEDIWSRVPTGTPIRIDP